MSRVRGYSDVPGLMRALRPMRRWVRGRLRLRVLVAVVSVAVMTLVAFDFAAVAALRTYLMDQIDTALRTTAQAAQPILVNLPGGPLDNQQGLTKAGWQVEDEMGVWVTTHRFVVGQYSVFYIPNTGVDDGIAGVDPPLPGEAMTSPDVPVGDLTGLIVSGRAQTTTSAFGDPLRSVAVHTSNGDLVFSTGLDGLDHTVNTMWRIMIIGSAAAALVIGLGGFWLLRRGLRPIETMAAQADRITAGNLTDRVTAPDPHSEVGRLGTALNGMLARIEAGQELTRRFFADASHELRTPLASLRANAELNQQGALPERAQVDEVMRRIALEARRMSGLVDDMLRLARLDQRPDQLCERVELSELVADCLERVLLTAPDHVWRAEISAGVATIGDQELLRRAVDNLLANVRTHTPAGTEATVALHERDGALEVEVSDTGPGVPPDRLPRIFDRFYRADTVASRPGSGLGLAIVTQIVIVHNGTVVAESNAPHGLRVRITLPATGSLTRPPDSPNPPAAV